jgi:hypothetical protein
VNCAASLRRRPAKTVAESFVDVGGEILPARVAVLACDYELCIALRERQVRARQMRADARDGGGITGRDFAREFLGLFAERLQRRARGKRLHGNLLS